MTPTRELCLQITEEAKKLTKHAPIGITAVYGGEGYARQEDELSRNPHLIVATPGRLIDYIKQKKVPLDRLRYLILDEADRMFDMGFIRDIRYIMKSVPEGYRTMAFSATFSYEMVRLAGEFMKDPVQVEIQSESVAVDRIAQSLMHLSRSEKMPYLVNSLLAMENPKAIVFTNTKFTVAKIVDHCHKYGIAATGISSLLDQKKRIRLLKGFKEGKYTVLVATDVASRGLDIDDITYVFNFDLPQDAESYVHRIGRTARAGKEGTAISFCSEDDYDFLPRIQRFLDDKIPVGDVNPEYVHYPKGEFIRFTDENHRKHEPREGGREKEGRSRTRRKKDRRDRPRQPAENAAVGSEAVPSQADASGMSSIRAADRAAILSGVNTKAGGGGVLTEDREYRARNEQKPGKRRKNNSNKNRNRNSQNERFSEGTEESKEKRTQYKDRDSRDSRSSGSGRRRSSSDSRTQGGYVKTSKSGRITTISKTPPKQGIVQKILSFFKK